jgi:hypothetical protein
MLINNITFVQRNIYKRSLIIENNIRFPVHLRYEDIFFDPLVLLYAKQIAAVDKVFYNYHIHSASTTHNTDESKYKDKLSVDLLLIEKVKKLGYYEKYKNEFDYLFFRKGYIHTTINYLINSDFIKREVVSEIKSKLLSLEPHYRNNPYYSNKKSFVIIDKMISSNSVILWKLLRMMAKMFLETI